MLVVLTQLVPGCIGAADNYDGTYRLDFADSTTRTATQAEILAATKAYRITAINAECRARLLARFGDPAEQVSRSIGIYGASEQSALSTGIAATVDASNTASDAVTAATTFAQVEAVAVTWPAI
jgi:hypothetical protein